MEHDPSYEVLAEIVRQSASIWHAADPYWMGEMLAGATLLEVPAGITYFSPSDLVISVRGGTRLSELQDQCRAEGLRVALGDTPFSSEDPILGEAIGLALPHLQEAQYGTWREWILGMTVVLGDGTVAKSGCRAVKSVAGYDAHKLFVGARGAFGVIAEVNLRLFPIGGQPPAAARSSRPETCWIGRTLQSEFARMRQECRDRLLCEDPATATLWGSGEPPDWPKEGWLMTSPSTTGSEDPCYEVGTRAGRPCFGDPWLRRAKNLLDPQGKLNPGQLEALP